jgi:hypothetical protein
MRKTQATAIVLFIFAIFQVVITEAQSRSSKWRNTEDSLVIVQSHLSRWHPYGGLHLSSDAEMYYLGPSFQVGMDVNLARRIALSTYLHYFYVGVNNRDNAGLVEKGRMRTFTGSLLIQLDAGVGWYKGVFIGFGIALQRYADRFIGGLGTWDDKRSTVTPAIRIGYLFPAGLHAIAIEFNGTGPYTYNDGPSTITEIFTQVSFGGRFVF